MKQLDEWDSRLSDSKVESTFRVIHSTRWDFCEVEWIRGVICIELFHDRLHRAAMEPRSSVSRRIDFYVVFVRTDMDPSLLALDGYLWGHLYGV